MRDFCTYRVGDCCDILDSMRVPLNSTERSEIVGSVPYYGANGIQGYVDKYLFDEPLILIAEDGGYFDEYATRPIAYRIEGKSWVNNHAHVLRAKDNFYQDFIFFSLVHKNLMPYIKGGTRAKLNQSELRQIELNCPDEYGQINIAKILNQVENLIEQTESLIAKYQQIKAGMMHDLFTRGVDANGHLRPPREQAPERYKESPVGWIPKEWKPISVGSCLRSVDAGKSYDCPDIPAAGDQWGLLKVSAVHPDGFKERENKVVLSKLCKSEKFLVKHGDLLITRANTVDLVGLVSHVESISGKVMLCDKTLRLTPDLNYTNERYLFWAMQGTLIRKQIETAATGSSGSMKNLSQSDIKRLKFHLPRSPEQDIICKILDTIFFKIRSYKTEKDKLFSLKSGLMHDLLTGRVRVNMGKSERSEKAA